MIFRRSSKMSGVFIFPKRLGEKILVFLGSTLCIKYHQTCRPDYVVTDVEIILMCAKVPFSMHIKRVLLIYLNCCQG